MMHMNNKKSIAHKRNYALARHHAWAGSVLLAILLAIRIFLETTALQIDDILFLFVGCILICYILIGLLFTYRYRSGILESNQADIIKQDETRELQRVQTKVQSKIEKKKAKNEYKVLKKQQNDKK